MDYAIYKIMLDKEDEESQSLVMTLVCDFDGEPMILLDFYESAFYHNTNSILTLNEYDIKEWIKLNENNKQVKNIKSLYNKAKDLRRFLKTKLK